MDEGKLIELNCSLGGLGMKQAQCIKGFSLEKCDDDGFTIENEYLIVEENTVWNISDDDYRVIGGEVRLENEDGTWLEISSETFEDCFEEITVK